MPFRTILDANVLFPFSLRDTLLRLAEPEPVPAPTPLYIPLWSERILDETARNLVENGAMNQDHAARLIDLMRSAFGEATVPEDAVGSLEDRMSNDPEDRHVLAAAVAGGADAIVTFNLRHFAPAACEPFGVEPTRLTRTSFCSASTASRRNGWSQR